MSAILLPFLRVPLELREQIYGYLLLDKEVIDWDFPSLGFHYGTDNHEEWLRTLRNDDSPCAPAVLRASRQTNSEASGVLYRRMFVLRVRANGFEFLEDDFGTLEKIRHFNLSAAKGLRSMILAPSSDQLAQIFAIRENFIALFNVLKRFPRLQYLEIMLVPGDRNGDW